MSASPSQDEGVQCYFAFSNPGEPAGDDRTEFFWLYKAAKRWKNEQFLKELEARVASAAAKERERFQGKGAELRRLVQWIEEATANQAQVTVDDFLRVHGGEMKQMGIEGAVEYFLRNRNARVEAERMEAMAGAEEQALRGIAILSDGLNEKRSDAAEYLLQLGLQITVILQAFYRTNPELFRQAAGHSVQLPVIASLRPGWVAAAEEHLRAVGVGKLRADGQFSKAAYEGEVYICREWAQAVVTCIDMNRQAVAMRELIVDYVAHTTPEDRVPLGISESRKDIHPTNPPEWVKAAAALPDFRKGSVGLWAKVARQLLRSEVPDLIARPEFAALVRSIQGRYRDAPGKGVQRPGTIANALRDRICEAIETIARADAPETS